VEEGDHELADALFGDIDSGGGGGHMSSTSPPPSSSSSSGLGGVVLNSKKDHVDFANLLSEKLR